MKLILKGVHYRVGDRMKGYVDEQLRQPLETYLPGPAAELDVILRDNNGIKGGLDKEVSLTVHIPGLASLHLTEISDDMFKAVHLMSDRVERAVRKHLERRREHSNYEAHPHEGIGNI
jgi:ribosomal subunit interface protein